LAIIDVYGPFLIEYVDSTVVFAILQPNGHKVSAAPQTFRVDLQVFVWEKQTLQVVPETLAVPPSQAASLVLPPIPPAPAVRQRQPSRRRCP
jgi:hypothetical protein